MEHRTGIEILLAEQNRINLERANRFLSSLDDAQAQDYKESLIADGIYKYVRMSPYIEYLKQICE